MVRINTMLPFEAYTVGLVTEEVEWLTEDNRIMVSNIKT